MRLLLHTRARAMGFPRSGGLQQRGRGPEERDGEQTARDPSDSIEDARDGGDLLREHSVRQRGRARELLRGSAADRAGVEPGDVVVAIEGRPVESAAQLRNELARAAVGSRLRLTVARGRRRLELTVAVEETHPGA